MKAINDFLDFTPKFMKIPRRKLIPHQTQRPPMRNLTFQGSQTQLASKKLRKSDQTTTMNQN